MMRGWAEISVFLGLAAAVHAAVIVTAFDGAGSTAGDRSAMVPIPALAAVPPEVERMVDAWDRAPAPAAAPDRPIPATVDTNPVTGKSEAAPTRGLRPGRMLTAPADAVPAARPAQPALLPEPPALAPEQPTAPGGDLLAALVALGNPGSDPARASVPAGPAAELPGAPPPVQSAPLPARAMTPPPPRPTRRAEAAGADLPASSPASAITSAASARMESPGPSKAEISAWGARIRARIDARKSPPVGRWSPGRVVLRITVSRAGRIQSAHVLQSSGDPRLDRAALGAVSRAGRMPPAPNGFERASANFDLPIAFAR